MFVGSVCTKKFCVSLRNIHLLMSLLIMMIKMLLGKRNKLLLQQNINKKKITSTSKEGYSFKKFIILNKF